MKKKMKRELDKTIKAVSRKIRRDEITPEHRAETLGALALLVKARSGENDHCAAVPENFFEQR